MYFARISISTHYIKHVRCAVLLLLCQDFTRRRQNKTLTKHTAVAQQHTHFCLDGLAAERKRESKEILRVGVGLASSFRLISHLIISPYMAKAIIFVWVWRCAGWARNDFPSNTCFPPNLTYDRSSVVSLFYIYLFKKGGEYNITHTSLELIIPPFTLSFVRLLLPYSPFFLFCKRRIFLAFILHRGNW
jgi:hypothetical protein